jgi:hypothetical protein
MRFVVVLLVLFGGFIGFGAYQQQQLKAAQQRRAATLQDSLRRADSLQRAAEVAAAETAAERAARASVSSRPSRSQMVMSGDPIAPSDAAKPLTLPARERKVVHRKPGPTNRH